MRAVMWEVTPDILERRHRTGADERDEVWEGVLHMGPSPNNEHQRLESSLEHRLRAIWMVRSGGEVLRQINVAGPGNWRENYRIPDLILLARDTRAIDRREYYEGGPEVVIEIRSPRDESYAKLPFYAEIGVREVWIIDRDTQAVEVHAAHEGSFRLVPAGADGWIPSAASGLDLRCHDGRVEMRWPDER